MRLTPPDTGRLPDPLQERARATHAQAIRELQQQPFARSKIIENISLPNATQVPVAHGLGRACVAIVSPVRGGTTSGRVQEVQTNTLFPRDQYVVLVATGFGATVTVDLLCVPA